METSIADESVTPTSTTSVTTPRIRAPRPVWQESILFMLSGGVLVSTWMVGRARDLKNIGTEPFKPGLWFFVPLIGLATLIAMPIFFRELRVQEGEHVPSSWRGMQSPWVLILFLIAILFAFSERLEIPAWIIAIAYLTSTLLYALLHHRINQWKSRLENVEFYGKPSGYTWYEWIVVVVGGLMAALITWVYLIEPLTIEKISRLESNQVIVNQEHGFSLTISGDNWTEVASGTFTGDESLYEAQGPLLDSWFIVYDNGIGSSLNQLTKARESLRDEFSGKPECGEERYLTPDEKSIVSFTQCKGKILGDPIATYSTFIEKGDRLLELYATVSGPSLSFESANTETAAIARSFLPLPEEPQAEEPGANQ